MHKLQIYKHQYSMYNIVNTRLGPSSTYIRYTKTNFTKNKFPSDWDRANYIVKALHIILLKLET